jgi:hypothetical protein
MQTEANSDTITQPSKVAKQFPPLELVTRPTVDTAAAAHYLNRSQQTMRIWACKSGNGPITPRRVGGRLAWPVAEIKGLLGA